MSLNNVVFTGDKCIMYTDGSMCDTTRQLLASNLFAEVVRKFVRQLQEHDSMLLGIFDGQNITDELVDLLIGTLKRLGIDPIDDAVKFLPGSEIFKKNKELLNSFVEELYDYWRSYNRFLVSALDTKNGSANKEKPYRFFNDTSEKLTDLIRAAYRDIQENITGDHCRVYRQVCAGPQVGIIAVKKDWPCSGGVYEPLKDVPIIRQILLDPPLIIDPPMNKRTGQFSGVSTNPLAGGEIDSDKWLCYPAKVGPLLIHIFFSRVFMELGCSLANLFELAGDEDLKRKPDAVYLYGMPEGVLNRYGTLPTVFFDDKKESILVGAVPGSKEFGYFGYLKKMTLTLHNIVMMKQGRMPYHGAMVRILLKNGGQATLLMIGDTGAGKSETLEAFRILGNDYIRNMIIIADDMGSLEIGANGKLIGYGTETGAFVRTDDLQPGYAFGQVDRAIIMSPQKVNARAVIPITTLANVLRGYEVDFLLYANNYEEVDQDHPIIERFNSNNEAIRVFREGTVMAKGTTTSTGIVHSYFANIFGPAQYRELHEELASKYFKAAFDSDTFVGQIRTRLGILGCETKGPEEGAKALFELISSKNKA